MQWIVAMAVAVPVPMPVALGWNSPLLMSKELGLGGLSSRQDQMVTEFQKAVRGCREVPALHLNPVCYLWDLGQWL